MRTNEERAALVRQRTEIMKEEQQRKKHKIQMAVLSGVSLASCDMYTALLGESLACARNDMKKYSKLFPALGVLFGIAVLVIAA